MQAFSYLQRNIADKKYIKLLLFGVLAFFYLSISTLNPYLPPFFALLLVAIHRVQRREFTLFALLYLLFFEADRGYYLFSSWVFAFVFINYLIPLLGRIIDCKKCIAAVSACAAYPLYFLFLGSVDTFFLNETILVSLTPLLVYMLFETLLVLGLE